MVPQEPPDPRTWLPGLALGRPETLQREDPADPGPGGRFPLFFKGNEVSTEGGGQGGATGFSKTPLPTINPSDLETRNLDPGPRSRTQNPGPRGIHAPEAVFLYF